MGVVKHAYIKVVYVNDGYGKINIRDDDDPRSIYDFFVENIREGKIISYQGSDEETYFVYHQQGIFKIELVVEND